MMHYTDKRGASSRGNALQYYISFNWNSC